MITTNFRDDAEVLRAINELDRSHAFQQLYLPTLDAEIEEVQTRILTFEITEKYTVTKLHEDRALYRALMKQKGWMQAQRAVYAGKK